jgi:hypothetical protein
MLVPPRRPRFPPDAPADIAAIASWLAGVYCPSFGFHLWTVNNLTAAVNRNFGVRLSPPARVLLSRPSSEAAARILPASCVEAAEEEAIPQMTMALSLDRRRQYPNRERVSDLRTPVSEMLRDNQGEKGATIRVRMVPGLADGGRA